MTITFQDSLGTFSYTNVDTVQQVDGKWHITFEDGTENTIFSPAVLVEAFISPNF